MHKRDKSIPLVTSGVVKYVRTPGSDGLFGATSLTAKEETRECYNDFII